MKERITRGSRAKRRVMVRYGTSWPERTAFTMNLSLEGAFLRTNTLHTPGSTIVVEFEIGGRLFNMRARVMWAKRVPQELAHLLPCGMGVRFMDPGPLWETFFSTWSQGLASPPRPVR